MLRRPTVLVVGAGASKEYQLPTGVELAATIAAKLTFRFEYSGLTKGDRLLWQAGQGLEGFTPKHVAESAAVISSGLGTARSIDDFLHRHSHDPCLVSLGKIAICEGILAAERNSSLYSGRDSRGHATAPLHNLKDEWLSPFFSMLAEQVPRTRVNTLFENLAIINFNYDRVIEHYLYAALQRAYSMNGEEAASVMAGLWIAHPYGRVGQLPWEGKGGSFAFGHEPGQADLVNLSRQIKTLTEENHDPAEVLRWQDKLSRASQVIFLGFAFHPQNMHLLGENIRQAATDVYASVYGLSVSAIQVASARTSRVLNRMTFNTVIPEARTATCATVVKEFDAKWAE